MEPEESPTRLDSLSLWVLVFLVVALAGVLFLVGLIVKEFFLSI